ncbi:MAG: AraC family transcriptional regulator, partial [bacterium]|nr:AraC family transcriptional regulator [bacterium]MDW8163846.1 AraC family transcriptional regulator [Candidatus Omnitrophota bacterium]
PPFFFHQFKRDMEEKILNFSIKFFPEEDFKKFINKPMRIEINKNEFKKIFKILVGNFIIGKKDITQKYLKTLILEIKETLKNISQPNIEEKISLIDEIIEENYNIPTIKLSNIAKILNSNPQYISRKYKEIKGENIFDLIRIKRLEKGFELITETDKPLKKISKECGFKNIFYFTKSFKKYFNITPATLRKQFSKLYK